MLKIILGFALIMVVGVLLALSALVSLWFIFPSPFALIIGMWLCGGGFKTMNCGQPKFQYQMESGKVYDLVYHQRQGGYALLTDEEGEVTFWQLSATPPSVPFAADSSSERRLTPYIRPEPVCGDN